MAGAPRWWAGSGRLDHRQIHRLDHVAKLRKRIQRSLEPRKSKKPKEPKTLQQKQLAIGGRSGRQKMVPAIGPQPRTPLTLAKATI